MSNAACLPAACARHVFRSSAQAPRYTQKSLQRAIVSAYGDRSIAARHAPPHTALPILLVTTCWWTSFARLAQLLKIGGCDVSALCPVGHPLAALSGIRRYLPQWRHPLRGLSAAIAACHPLILVPGDERALAQLHDLHRHGSDAERRLVERSLGPMPGYAVTSSRLNLLTLAQRLGIPAAEATGINSEAELQAWMRHQPAPWVLKSSGSWSGMGVCIAQTPGEALAAFRRLRSPPGRLFALKRLLVNRDPYWLADRQANRRTEVIAQRYIQGQRGDLAMFCRQGEMIHAVSAITLASQGPTGPSLVVRLVDRPDFSAAAASLARELGLSGFYGLDFIVEAATGRALLIELNPRPTPLANIRAGEDGDLVGKAMSALGYPPGAALQAAASELVAYFPRAQALVADAALLSAAYHDVPWEEPDLMTEMLRTSWPDRQILPVLFKFLRRFRPRGMAEE